MRKSRGQELPVSKYALIGDGRTAALIAVDGSIDWLCHGRFDGPAVFCRLLDIQRGGYFQIAPQTQFQSSQRYLPRTNILVTEFHCATGAMRLTDFMPLGLDEAPMILRKLEGVSGEVNVHIDFAPTFDFVREDSIVEIIPGGCGARGGSAQLRLSCPSPMALAAGGATSSLRLRAGETRWINLSQGTPPLDSVAAEDALRFTRDSWKRWSAHGNYSGSYQTLVHRSALVLKLLIHEPTGAMVAAPTTSLPETLGGVRNWDYRFTWLRDTSWVVSALMDLGYHDESMAFIDWLESLGLGEAMPSVFYDLDRKVPSSELELRHLRGYRDSRPVRIGNAAAGQDQHDVFGEVISAIHMCSEGMASMRPLRPGLWKLVSLLADRATAHWEHPDFGMWEVRDRRRHYLSSQLLCWTALDRAIAMARRDGLFGPIEKWENARQQIRRAIVDEGFDAKLGSFKRAANQCELDASGLLLPRYGILPPDDPRFLRMLDTIRQRLGVGSGLLRRYLTPDGLPGTEGAFTACSFWLVDCLARLERVAEARELFEQVTAHASDTGLLSEEIDPASGELVGNYPQAFTHLALIRAAVSIARAEEPLR